MSDLANLIERVAAVRATAPKERSILVALSGIDGSGKGWLSGQLVTAVRERGYRVAAINIDGWLNLPPARFNPANPAEHFYLHAIRFDEMFAQLVLPLRDNRSVTVTVDHVEETARDYERRTYTFHDIDVIVLEGIYLLKSEFVRYYDLSVWIDCTFETALERAIARGQEALGPEATVRAYQTIYFPAQETHFRRDRPLELADMVVANDPRLISARGSGDQADSAAGSLRSPARAMAQSHARDRVQRDAPGVSAT